MNKSRRPKKRKTRVQKHGQQKFVGVGFSNQSFFGGSLTTKRAHRTARPLSTKYPIHVILRSSQAQGVKSFWHKGNKEFIKQALKKYSKRWSIEVLSCANVGNHIHLLIKLSHRYSYEKFIKSLTGAISLRLTKWNKNRGERGEKFWDFKPYTRLIIGFFAKLRMQDYMDINQLEGPEVKRLEARMILENLKFSSG